ncbi:MAG: hypothetical protein JST16_12470 [Bdellovibrionales bacterium]|nr:hypothetical protein [Bdellovibrionales bacterium]
MGRVQCLILICLGALSAPLRAQTSVDLKGYMPLDRLGVAYRRYTLPRIARSVVIVPNQVVFERAVVSENEGITFQGGEVNPPLDYRKPFCTLKFARDPLSGAHYHSAADLVHLVAAAPIVSGAIVTIDGRKTSGNLTTMIYVNRPGQPQVSDTVELIQCMVAKNDQTLYREPSAGELVPTFGEYAKVYIRVK